MRSNRFDFLEFGEQPPNGPAPDGQGSPADADPKAPLTGHTLPPAYVKTTNDYSVAMSDGRPMAQVNIPDPRGYLEVLDSAKEEPLEQMEQDALERAQQEVFYQTRRTLQAVEIFGERGLAAGQFNFPTGMATDRDGILFIADTYNHRVQRVTTTGGVAIVGGRGQRAGQFMAPMGIATDEERAFYIVEQGNHRVQKFSSEGVLELIFGRQGRQEGEFRSPMGIAVMPGTREIFVADTGNGRVQRFDYTGRFMGFLGAPGSIHPPLSNPQAVACDKGGNIFVADTLANRIARYDPSGRFVAHYGAAIGHNARTMAGTVRFQEPRAITSDECGDLYIADGEAGSGRLIVVAIDSGNIRGCIEKAGRGVGTLARPSGLALMPPYKGGMSNSLVRGDIYLADTMNHRILRFAWK
ncbi:MAG TPA: NHL repeat-containing protein [Capsulimonadaceae bacterium]|nr:NHL repeat-containing protein [Capsulimonadaceae bacterium]